MPLDTRGVLAMAGGFVCQMFLGCLTLYGAISLYLASYYWQYDDTVTTRFLITFLPLRGLLLLVFLPSGAVLVGKIGYRGVTLIMGATIVVCLSCLIVCTNKYLFLLFYSMLFGVTTINFMPPIICAWKHFPDNRGTVTGITMCGFAMGSLVFTAVTKFIVNPHNKSPTLIVPRGELVDHYYEADVANNVPTMYTILWEF